MDVGVEIFFFLIMWLNIIGMRGGCKFIVMVIFKGIGMCILSLNMGIIWVVIFSCAVLICGVVVGGGGGGISVVDFGVGVGVLFG